MKANEALEAMIDQDEIERITRCLEAYADRMKQANRYEAKGHRAARDGDYDASARMFEAAADQWNEARAAAQAGRDEIATDDAAEKANLMLDYAMEAASAHLERKRNQ